MAIVFVLVALFLVVVGGLLTAINAGLGVVGRNDLIELAATKKKPQALHRLASDLPAHITALRFVRVVVETMAAVLITLAVSLWLGSWWQVLLVSGALLTAVSFVVVGSSPRSVGERNASTMVGLFAGLVRAVRMVVPPPAAALGPRPGPTAIN